MFCKLYRYLNSVYTSVRYTYSELQEDHVLFKSKNYRDLSWFFFNY